MWKYVWIEENWYGKIHFGTWFCKNDEYQIEVFAGGHK